jgi:phosphopantothenoylcysteine decarboxylase/phosphopantothenate--cysteine ligase
MANIKGKYIILGITGSIASYKTPAIVNGLRQNGAAVRIILTESGSKFVSPLTLQALSGEEVQGLNWFDGSDPLAHIHLAQQADLIVICPATADAIAKIAHGFADNILGAVLLAAKCPVLIFPSMNTNMYEHPATQSNLKRLKSLGYEVVEPSTGRLASGVIGRGRMPEPDKVIKIITNRISRGKK